MSEPVEHRFRAYGRRDVVAVEKLIEHLRPTLPPGAPLWLCGHSGGGCFAHLAAYHLATNRASLWPAGGVLSNAGYLWPWLREALDGKRPPRRYPVLLRGARNDPWVPARRWWGDALVYEGHRLTACCLPGAEHIWHARHDEAAIQWMDQAVRDAGQGASAVA